MLLLRATFVSLVLASALAVAPLRPVHRTAGICMNMGARGPERDRKAGKTASMRSVAASPMTKGASRARAKVVRELSGAMMDMKIPGTEAVIYAEILADHGIHEARELPHLDKRLLDLCDMRRMHRKQLAVSGVLLNTPEIGGATMGVPPAPEAPSRPTVPVVADNNEDETEQVEELTVTEALAGMRVDAALATLLPPLSRSYFGELIAERLVTVDGSTVKKSVKLVEGALLRVRLRPSPELSVLPEAIELDVLHEDGHMIAINKPAGMVVHPAPAHWSGTFVNALVHRMAQQAADAADAPAQSLSTDAATALPDAFGDGLRPGVVHRLDRFTSGVLLAAKSISAQRGLLAAFAERRVFKVGCPHD